VSSCGEGRPISVQRIDRALTVGSAQVDPPPVGVFRPDPHRFPVQPEVPKASTRARPAGALATPAAIG